MDDATPVFNSRIIKTYLEYLVKHYSDVDVDSILKYAAINRYEVDDPGYWFSQCQVDRFHDILSQKTGDPNISREAGRYAASSKASGAIRQYALGLMSPTSAYLLMEKLYPTMSRGATIKVTKLGPRKIEIVSTPKPGINEKHFQCENRIGQFEAVAKLFTKRFATIDHPSCFHRGDDCCRYIITWEKVDSFIFKRLSNYSMLLSIAIVLFIFSPRHFHCIPGTLKKRS
jgi:hypothetical protein